MAMCESVKDVVWMRQLLCDLGEKQLEPTVLLCDNQGAVKLAHSNEYHRRTKHIDIKYHFVRELQEAGTISTQYVQADEQVADILTKALPGPSFQRMRGKLGMSEK